jgi:flavorubredoxin
MMTYEPQSRTLFSCDAFGSYGAAGDRICDDEFNEEEHTLFEKESLRYYANIVASLSNFVKSALEKLKSLPVNIIAPSHGMIWRTNPQTIIDRYARYAGYNTGGAQEKDICVIWGSMYGNTRIGVNAVIEGIKEEGVPFTEIEIPKTDVSEVLANAFSRKGLVIAMPTYEYKMFPPMAYVLELLGRKHVTDKIVFRLGSWGWSGGAEKDFIAVVDSYKWTFVESCEWQGVPTEENLMILKERGRELARQVRNS